MKYLLLFMCAMTFVPRTHAENSTPAETTPNTIADGSAETPDEKVLRLLKQIEQLERRVKYLESKQSELLAELDRKNRQLLENAKGQSAAKPNPSPAEKASPPAWKWTVDARVIQYDTKTKGRIKAGGTTSTFSAETTTTVENALEAFGQFVNASRTSQDFSFTVIIYRKTSFPVKNPPVLGQATFRTGTLKAGETRSFAVDVPVSSVLGSWNVRIIDVKPLGE
ncbi:MAG: hypothetical protein WD768_05860 [Phycisphaeraceae bacterium]